MSFSRRFTFDDHPIYLLGERALGLKGQYSVQDYYNIQKECLESGNFFEDSEFPASDKSIFHSHDAQLEYKWLRPKEICENPHFFVDKYSRFDVNQGDLGDCWLLAAAANLTQNEKLFYRVVCDDNSFDENYAGIFHFCFWQFGKWVDVVIDDRLPTFRGTLIYIRSTERNEFWSALLEKAYAKLHGSYEALDDGTAYDAFEDFTGGVAERFNLKEIQPNFFQTMLQAFDNHSMMGCSMEAVDERNQKTPQGLVRGHAYSISNIKMMDIATPNLTGQIPLVRLRNPWGNDVEWNGAFSDGSKEWKFISDDVKKEIGLTFDYDGEFWMTFRDFIKYFDRIDICALPPKSLPDCKEAKNWNWKVYEGEWVPGITSGGCRNFLDTFHHNPQYVMRLKDPDEGDDEGKCSVVVALMQKARGIKRKQCQIIGFAIYKVEETDLVKKPMKTEFFQTTTSVARSTAFINMREVSNSFKLSTGYYLIVPSTYEPNKEAEFLIRLVSKGRNTFDENDAVVGMSDPREIAPITNGTTKTDDAIEELFRKTAGEDGEIDWKELKQILDLTLKNFSYLDTFSKDTCRSLVAMMDTDNSGKLGLDEFRAVLIDIANWKGVFKFYDKDHSNKLDSFELREALASAGYFLNNKILNSLVYRYGDTDGTITFDDFLMLAIKTKTMIQRFKEKDLRNTNEATLTIDEWIKLALYS